MAPINAQLHHPSVFNNKGFCNAAVHSRYLRRFHDPPIYPSLPIHASAFSKYDMNIPSLIHSLGWQSLVENMWLSYCPEAVRLFYVNIQRGPGTNPAFFTTMVFNFEIKVTPELLATTLDFPHTGLCAGTDSQFGALGFDFMVSLESLTRDIGQFFPSCLAAGRLPDDLKVLHFFYTRSFLPRDLSTTDLLHPSDLWVLSHARAGTPISYASLMFHHMLKYGMEYFGGPLPFGPQITRLLSFLRIDMRDKLHQCNVLDDLRPQHVLAKLDALVGLRKPLTGSGGVETGSASYASGRLVGALVDAVITVIKRESSSEMEQSITLKKLRQEDLMWPKFVYESGSINDPISSDSESESSEASDEDGVSKYEYPPEYPF
ncbi:unnamed protein product [Linum trigynum]|uniref:Uncharacterized protein n=1 Tax=Linum trigynum TaxID=586398 RepID=A0AAV2DZ56_9ROSI